jgi:hypothetical protein
MPQPSDHVIAQLKPFFAGARPARWQRVTRGYTAAERWLLVLKDKRSCFIKVGDDTQHPGAVQTTAAGLRAEYLIYSQVKATWLPQLLYWVDEPGATILVLEDLSHTYWPPPWSQERIDIVLRTLDDIHATRIEGLPAASLSVGIDNGTWASVAADPEPFLDLGLVTRAWLDAALPALQAAETTISLAGDDLCHYDVRSDNVCFEGEYGIFIDWNWAGRGNGTHDTAFWLPSLHAEGGPPPEAILPDAAGYASHVSGFFAGRAGLPPFEWGPHIRALQLEQLRTALPWAQRALGLPPLDGPSASND